MTFREQKRESRAAPGVSLGAAVSFALAFASLALIAIVVATRQPEACGPDCRAVVARSR